eukprot:CAMPEP_0201581194 /NCGR_PEP_ID=MMETSP0190_2-20130828/64527_1 /ASSEMBLY_ACC=CAM_ASM_000263 /TAXON_ID=37353 /ORGANISM="Rosalina sp." /LENGTH=473 /DNA_ID=CAMNT_0048018647 /DNA_START=376 /DNA_END=1794 /DNA_ORIENTATION=+
MYIADTCPEWTCNSITTTIDVTWDSDACKGPFTTDAGNNAWKNEDTGRYFYFHTPTQEWRCSNGMSQACTATAIAGTSDYAWATLTGGTYTSNEFWVAEATTPSSSKTGNYQINCLDSGGNAGNQVTGVPTKAPTDPTPEPSRSPVVSSTVPSGQGYCIYGRSGENTVINGYWEPTGNEINFQPSYSKTIRAGSGSCGVVGTMYLYRLTTEWRIGPVEGSGSTVATCFRDTDLSYPACNSLGWYVQGITGVNINDKTVQIGTSCDLTTCDTITTTSTAAVNGNGVDCTGPFAKITDGTPNAYKKAGEELYFYYVPWLDTWVCAATLDNINTCPASYYDASDAGIGPILTGSIVSGGITIACDGNASPAPSESPTTSKSPSRSPTRSPQTSGNKDTPAPTRSPQTSSGNNNDNNNNTPAPTSSPQTSSGNNNNDNNNNNNNTPEPTTSPNTPSGNTKDNGTGDSSILCTFYGIW